MTTQNHIVGGTLITAFFCSLFDVNIFDNPLKLIFVAGVSILADIDNPRAPAGRIFRPLSRWIFRRYGHRTLTHSLLFVGVLTLVFWLIEGAISGYTFYSKLFFLSYSVHLFLDMVTLAGVPLFYPIWKNPCVIPGSRNARIKTGDFRQEFGAFIFFCVFGFICYPLFANGFWISFNSQLGSSQQVKSQYYKEKNLLKTNYEFANKWKHFKGVGYVIDVEPIVIYDEKTHTFLKPIDERAGHYTLERTNKPKITKGEQIKIQRDTAMNALYYVSLQSLDEFYLLIDGKFWNGKSFEGSYINRLEVITDAHKDELTAELQRYILEKQVLAQRERQFVAGQNHLKRAIEHKKKEFYTANIFRQADLKNEIKALEKSLKQRDFRVENQRIDLKILEIRQKIDKKPVIFVQYEKIIL
ncbi:metal-dependent hydrolase [Breoghania sp.]|uniref:metal-dependent hydrolase n=1 Tax=Breoghania sp. TaxID=2065378 RepID=UPI00262A5E7A|nr:metal-dependent hydrolase [Breoghania sp.]MDJ0933739.1 metal-dependent hydrolase [Breoghania sp.]